MLINICGNIHTPPDVHSHDHHVSWSCTNFSRILSASEVLMRPAAFLLGAGMVPAGRRSPAGCWATISRTLGTSSKLNALRVDDSSEPESFFSFTCFSAFRRDFASGLLCLLGSGVLHLNLLSGAIFAMHPVFHAELKPNDCKIQCKMCSNGIKSQMNSMYCVFLAELLLITCNL